MLERQDIYTAVRKRHERRLQRLLKKVRKKIIRSGRNIIEVGIIFYPEVVVDMAEEELKKEGWKFERDEKIGFLQIFPGLRIFRST